MDVLGRLRRERCRYDIAIITRVPLSQRRATRCSAAVIAVLVEFRDALFYLKP
jgi:hypothetical protein